MVRFYDSVWCCELDLYSSRILLRYKKEMSMVHESNKTCLRLFTVRLRAVRVNRTGNFFLGGILVKTTVPFLCTVDVNRGANIC